MGNNGFIKLYRKMREWGWYSDPPTKDVFLHLLILAQYEETYYRGVHLEIGDVIATYPDIAAACGLSIKNVRTAIEHLKATGEVAVTRHPKFTVYSIQNYVQYQAGGRESGSQPAVNRQSTGSHPDIKELKNLRNKEREIYKKQEISEDKSKKTSKEIKDRHGEFSNVLLSAEEFIKLAERMGDICRNEYIERLSTYLEQNGRKYKSHYATILNWWRKDGEPIERSPEPFVMKPDTPREITADMTAEEIF